MLTLDEIESGLYVTHKNTGLRYSVVEAEDDEVLLSPEQEEFRPGKIVLVAQFAFQLPFSSHPTVKQLLDFLGFSGVKVSKLDSRRRGQSFFANVQHDPVRDREICPIPFFGSQANGKLKVLGLWDLPGERGILSAVGACSKRS